MVRKTPSYAAHIIPLMYKHRDSAYSKRPGYVDLAHAAEFVADEQENSEYYIPPKEPIPDVVLRGDIMPKQRSRVAL